MVKESSPIARQARSFLRTGQTGSDVNPSELARACDRLIRAETQKSLPRAVALAEKFAALARRTPQMPLQLALRSLGWALHCSGKYRQAERAYLEARALVVKDAPVRARIDRILIDVYMYLGDFRQARRRAKLAIQTFGRLGDREEQAKTRINYGNLFHRQDRHREAQRQYQLARDYLERSDGNHLVLALCYYNLANTHVQLFDFQPAREFYGRAKQRFLKLGYNLYATECDYGLAWLHMLQADYHVALETLTECERAYQKAAQYKGVMLCRLDRAEAYLGLNLLADAYQASKSAEPIAKRLGIAYEAGKAAFFRARAAYALGKTGEAARALDRAVAGFRKEGNRGFEAAARLFRAQVTATGTTKTHLKGIRNHFIRSQLPLWEAICDLELLSRWPHDSDVLKRLSRNPAVQSVPHLFAQWQTRLGDNKLRAGKHGEAAGHWKQAVEVLEAVRAKLPPVELRGAFMRGRADPYERVIASSIDSHPGQAAVWVDRFKTVGAWAAGGDAFDAEHLRDEADKSLAKLASQVSALASRIGTVTGTRGGTARASSRALRRMQRQVRDRLATLERSRSGYHPRDGALYDGLKAISHKQPVVQFYQRGDDIFSFVHSRGESRVRRHAGGAKRARELFGVWQILVNRSLASGRRPWRADLEEERLLFDEFGTWLWEPLGIPENEQQVLIVPDGILANVPWSAFRVHGRALIDSYRILLTPTIQHHIHASRIAPGSRRIAVFAGSDVGLRYTRRELDGILDSEQDVTVYDPCTRQDWPTRGDWQAWHYTGHARLRSDNPFYSSLLLADGPLFAADFRLRQCRVGLVTLAACRTGHHSMLAEEEASGLVRCLLEMGARNVVGSHWAVADKPTAYWMRELYKAVLDGTPPAEAARQASIITREKYPSAYEWAPFSVLGAG